MASEIDPSSSSARGGLEGSRRKGRRSGESNLAGAHLVGRYVWGPDGDGRVWRTEAKVTSAENANPDD